MDTTTYDAIISNIKAVLPQLFDGTTSDVDVIEKESEAIGITIDNTLNEIANSESIITNTISTKNYGKNKWYVDKALQYQNGVSLLVDINGNYYYPSIDTTKLLVSQSSLQTDSLPLIMKVAKTNNTTKLLEALTGDELTAFNSYMTLFEVIGIPLTIVSNDANVFNYNMRYDYLSSFNLTTLKTNLANAEFNYQTQFVFNGTFNILDYQTYIKANVPGIRSVFPITAQITDSLGGSIIDVLANQGECVLSAGYFNYGSKTQSFVNV